MATPTETSEQDQDRDQADSHDDSALLDSVEEALRDGGFPELADRIAVGDITGIAQVSGALLRDLRAADEVLAGQVEEHKAGLVQEKEEQERAAELARLEEERAELERVEAERKAKIETGELTYADEHPVEYHDLPTNRADKAAFNQTLTEFGKHTQAWQADRYERMTPEERGVIEIGYGAPLSADLKGFEPKSELTDLERQSLEAQTKQFKTRRLFVNAPTLDLITKAEQQRDHADTRAESDAGLQALAHLAKGVEADARKQLPFQTPHDKNDKYPNGRPDKTVYARTPDGGAIITEQDFGTGQTRVTEFSAEEYQELKAQLMLEAPEEMPPPISGSTLVDEMSRPVHGLTEEPGEPVRVQVNPLAKTEEPSTPQAFLETHGAITAADLKLWPSDTIARFHRDFPDASRQLMRGETVHELS